MSLVDSVVTYGDASLLVTGHTPSDCIGLLLSSEGERTAMPSEDGIRIPSVLQHGELIRLPLELVHKVADSLEEYVTDERERRAAYRLRQTVCTDEQGVRGVVTGYRAGTFTGRALQHGNVWESKNPKKIANSLYAYTETLITGE